jgi:CRP-like cAMP-binding protein
MDVEEFGTGIRDLSRDDVEERLIDGFDPHISPVAVGDTSLFSRFIFSSMRLLDAARAYDPVLMGSPDTALKGLPLTSEGAIGWSHFYAGCFLNTYLRYPNAVRASDGRYQNRVAKFFSRVMLGSVLAQMSAEVLEEIGFLLAVAIRSAVRKRQSVDEAMSAVIIDHSRTALLLDEESLQLLRAAGKVRNGEKNIDTTAVSAMEARLFYEAFHQGVHRRKIGEGTDPLVAYALAELLRDVGKARIYSPFARLTQQGVVAKGLYYLPLKNRQAATNPGIFIRERHGNGEVYRTSVRPPGRLIGEAALFGAPSSASVFIDSAANQAAEVYFLEIESFHSLLNDPKVQRQLQRSLLETREARRLDALLRYLAYEAGLFTRRVLPYTSVPRPEDLSRVAETNPFNHYDLGMGFHDALCHLATTYTLTEKKPPITVVRNQTEKEITLFEVGSASSYLYVVSQGVVRLKMRTGEELTLGAGEYFGESPLLGLPTSGTATLPSGANVIRMQADWFMRFTQSRQPLSGADTLLPQPPSPVQFLYHMAAVGYGRIYGRLLTQCHPH